MASPTGLFVDRAWATGPINRFVETRTQVQERRIDALLGVGNADQAVAELEVLLAQHPFRERFWRQRMIAMYRTGRTDEALRTYRQARQTLLDEVGIEPGPELVELERRILNQDPELGRSVFRPSVQPVRSVEVRLPRRRLMLGRDADLRAVSDLVRSSRLVTIVGAAGCGKTLLATEAARAAAQEYPDGVWFVDLSTVEADGDLAVTISATLDLAVPESTAARAALADFGADRRCLLVLDNCEHVLDDAADLTELLTESGRQVSVLATSREPLGVTAEATFLLAPLAVGGDAAAGEAPISEEPAVALFVARARLPADTDVAERVRIRQICRAVDGIPLAIELAAALTATYSLAEIADLVEHDPGQLAAVGRGQARHHQTLIAAIERSHRLLSPEEQVMHRRLAVLPGSFGRDLAESVAGPDLHGQSAGLLARLVHRSMLNVSHSGDTTRFTQLAPIRGHAAHALQRYHEVELAERFRDDWVSNLAAARPRLGRPEEADWYAALLRELPTIRATLNRRLLDRPDLLGCRIACQIAGFCYYLDLLEDGARWAEAAARESRGHDLPGVIARLTLVGLLAMRNRADRSRQLAAEALAMIEIEPEGGFRLAGQGRALSEAEQIELAEWLIGTASSFSNVRDAEMMRASLDLVARADLLSSDVDLALTHAANSCLLEVVQGSISDVLVKAQTELRPRHRPRQLVGGMVVGQQRIQRGVGAP